MAERLLLWDVTADTCSFLRVKCTITQGPKGSTEVFSGSFTGI